MNTRRMTPAELLAIIDAAELPANRIAGIIGVQPLTLACYLASAVAIPAPVSRLFCIHLLFDGLAVDLARPWVPDELAAVLAPSI